MKTYLLLLSNLQLQLAISLLGKLQHQSKEFQSKTKSQDNLFYRATWQANFYSHYPFKLPFETENLTIPNNGKVVLYENLTFKNRRIFSAAQRSRREKKIAQVFTQDGIVTIRFNKGKQEPSYAVRKNAMLETLVAQQTLLQSTLNDTTNPTDDTHTAGTQSSTIDHWSSSIQRSTFKWKQQQHQRECEWRTPYGHWCGNIPFSVAVRSIE